ncbi:MULTISPECIES: hypothetical protein [unclassified Streptomyces]|uniref:hypothetical protein n=1 Tax=unclassified Streptomyces TaxID=2593676 RepID=UPI002DDA42CC|nr:MULTISPECIES: hypothetical protein [unclassified Streptomyces]WSA95959.1 hypothetical protein OIE63_33685 [Streptomyces sp. NBC_01795]WSB80375.1 hypothetical protein OHB04_34800 [Streptomyces sp. NBC_01775]WSS11420.1 hypothetical protein OG533_05465 [Streptomyces sp. NBC_01186]WSS40127.1 hypothetical protein OG220_05560 [Streptomyces sp. NBC_01187]
MFTILLIVGLVVILAVALGLALRFTQGAGVGGPGVKRRFGPEYDRAVARHNGDTKAARRELNDRLRRYGSLKEKPLVPGAQERYAERWTAVQEHFVESPPAALNEADVLLAQLSTDRGYPPNVTFEERIDALSVHHAHHVHGYLRVHEALRGENTEEMRAAFLEARGLFEVLATPHHDGTTHGRGLGHTRGIGRTHDKHEPTSAAGRGRESGRGGRARWTPGYPMKGGEAR